MIKNITSLATLLMFGVLMAPGMAGQEEKTAAAAAMQKARDYLASRQNKDGSFPIKPDKLMGGDPYTVGVTALSIFALLDDESQRDAVEKAAGFLVGAMDKKGYIRIEKDVEHAPFFEHALATQALAEFWVKDKEGKKIKHKELAGILKDRVQKAVRWIVDQQIENGGWAYSPSSDVDEAFGTAFQLDALRTAREAGIEVPEKVIKKGVDYLKDHAVKGGGFRCKPGWKVSYEGSATVIAILISLGEADAKETRESFLKYLRTKSVADYLKWLPEKEGKPVWTRGGIQLSGIAYALFAFKRSGDVEAQKEYFPKLKEELLKQQKSDGSWSGIYGDAYGTAFTLWLLSTMK